MNFLDVQLNLETGTYCPYRKPNDTIKYVHSKSNHPPNVLRELPKSVNKKLSTNSYSQKEFDETKEPFQQALNDSGYKYTLKYEEPTARRPRNRKSRDITWFNPPYNEAVTTDVGRRFLGLIDKHFPKTNPLSRLINRNTVKVSYSCTRNVKCIIQSHNAKLLNADEQVPPREEKSCNCQRRNKHKCPLENDCHNQKDVIYHAKVISDEPKEYIGSTVNFKKRWYGHTESFRNSDSKHKTTLATHVWEKKLNPTPRIKWSIIARAPSYRKGNRQCDLCLTEKLHIANTFNNPAFLNKRSELALRCRHRTKFLLSPPTEGEEE